RSLTQDLSSFRNLLFSNRIDQGPVYEQVEIGRLGSVLRPTAFSLKDDLFCLNSEVSEPLILQDERKPLTEENRAHTCQRTAASQNFFCEMSRLLTQSLGSTGTDKIMPAVVALKFLPAPEWRWGLIVLSLILGILAILAFEQYRAARMKELNAALAASKEL